MKALFLTVIFLTGLTNVNAQRRPVQRDRTAQDVSYDAGYYKNLSERQLKKSKILLPISGGLAAAGTGLAIAFAKLRSKGGSGPRFDGLGYFFGAIAGYGGAIGTFIPGMHLRRKSKENHARAIQLSPDIGFKQIDYPNQTRLQPTVGIKLNF